MICLYIDKQVISHKYNILYRNRSVDLKLSVGGTNWSKLSFYGDFSMNDFKKNCFCDL